MTKVLLLGVTTLVAGFLEAKEPLLVLHLDFNTIQMRKEVVIGCLRSAARAGYNAVLWEVEDKIRWESCPECVHPEAFTKAEFREMLAEARRLKLEPIPLLQVFGHAEYVLLNGGHGDWMEDPKFPACYCVSKPEVRGFLTRLLHEYLELFGDDVRQFHLGGDEAKVFGTCPVCSKRKRMDLYVEHLEYMAAPLVRKSIKPGIWCDMVLGDSEAFKAAKLPKGFTVWHWDYEYDGKGRQRAWTGKMDVLKQLGHDIVFCAASSSGGDGPFLPRYGFHMDNVAAAAELVRRDGLYGLCVTSWSVRKFPKSLQMPILDFAAKRLLNPDSDVRKDEVESYARYFGPVKPETMRTMTEWYGHFGPMDASGWLPFIKHARPAPKGTLRSVLEDEERRNPAHRKMVIDRAREISSGMRAARADFEKDRRVSRTGKVLENGLSLAVAFLEGIVDSLSGKPLSSCPKEETKAYYLQEQPELSASNCTEIVWSVLDDR